MARQIRNKDNIRPAEVVALDPQTEVGAEIVTTSDNPVVRELSSMPDPSSGDSNQPVKLLASLIHDLWIHWMSYLVTKGWTETNGNFTLHKESIERWRRQMATAFADLPVNEQESDIKLAEALLADLLKLRIL